METERNRIGLVKASELSEGVCEMLSLLPVMTEEEEKEWELKSQAEKKNNERALVFERLRAGGAPERVLAGLREGGSGFGGYARLKGLSDGWNTALLTGSGRGKTSGAVCWMGAMIKAGFTARYVAASELLDELNDFRARRGSESVRRAQRVGALIVDNLENVFSSEISKTSLLNLVTRRRDGGCFTLLISRERAVEHALTAAVAAAADEELIFE